MKSTAIALGVILCLTVADAVHSQQHRQSSSSRRRRRRSSPKPNTADCGLATKLMSEMVDLRAELNAMKKGAREMEEEILTLKKETETLKAKGLPFEVDYRDKTVLLVGWNLKVLASEEDEGVREPNKMPKCKEDCGKGNLIVGRRHRYSGAAESFFSGYGHKAEGYGHAFLGGYYNKAAHAHNAIAGGYTNVASGESGFIGGGRSGKTGKLASTVVGGFGNTCNSSLSVVVGGRDNVVKSWDWESPSAIVGGQSNFINYNGSGVIMAGYNNTLMSNHVFIVGGANNMMNSPNSRHSGMVGGVGNLMAGWGLGAANLVLGGHMYNASSYESGTWGRRDKEYEIVPITWKPANVPPPTWKPPQ